MAKGKHSTALFEVIHSSKRFDNKEARDGIVRTPKWWFKGRGGQGNAARTAASPVAPGGTAAADPTDPTSSCSTGTTSTAPADAVPLAADAHAAPEPDDVFDPTAPAASPAPAPEKELPALNGRAGIRVALDSERHELTLRVRYTTAVVTAFTVLVVVALAYVTGRHTGRGPAPAYASLPTEEIKAGPANPEVLDIDPANRVPPPESATPRAPADPQPRVERPRTGGQVVPPAVAGGPRKIGLNYVVVQSYPDERMAREAVDVLRRSGVEATIERGITGWSDRLYLVVGTEGFTGISSPEYKAYVQRIRDISDRYAKANSFSAFQPTAKKWTGPGQ